MDAPEPIEAEDTQPEAPEAPPTEDTPPAPEHDYEKRYKDLRSEFDKRNEELKLLEQLRSDDPAVYSNALKELGFGGDEPEDDTPDEDAPPWAHLEKDLKALQDKIAADEAAIAEQIRQQEEIAHVQSQLGEVDPDKTLTQEEVDLLLAAAYAKRGEDGLPDVKTAYGLYEKGLEVATERWRKSKKAPHVPKGGPAANPANPNLDDEAERHAWILSQIGASN